MDIAFDIRIHNLKKDCAFEITWEDKINYSQEIFINSASEIVEYVTKTGEDLWQDSREYRLELGQRLFFFLNGPNGILDSALIKADEYGESLLLNLCALEGCENWPFELIAKNNVFLVLQERVHLVRRLSDRGRKKLYSPKKRPLRILFMCCAPVDYIPQLDFHHEEEKILKELDGLSVDIDIEDSGTLAGLRHKLEQSEYDVIHLSGHAGIDENNEPYFITEMGSGSYQKVSAEELWMKSLIYNPPKLLFLSGCRTAQSPKEVNVDSFAHRILKNKNSPVVLGWNYLVDEVNTANTAAILYRELSLGKTILDALWLTRYILENTPDNKAQNKSCCIWPQLRLFSDSAGLNALVVKGKKGPSEKFINVVLREKELSLMKDGFVGRRRQLQDGVKAVNNPDGCNIGALILGAAGVGKSSLAVKISQHCCDYNMILIKGKLDDFSLTEALKNAFRGSNDQKGKKILNSKKTMCDKLSELCISSFREKKYLLMLDDFHENLIGWELGMPEDLLPDASELLTILLKNLLLSGKNTSLIITSRFSFYLHENGSDLVKKRLKRIMCPSFQELEQRKMAYKLANSIDISYYSLLLQLNARTSGNPLLMKEIAGLLRNKTNTKIEQLQLEAEELRIEFIQKHRLKEILTNNGEELSVFLYRLSIFRKPVPLDAIELLAYNAGITEWKTLLNRGIDLSLVEHFQTQNTVCLVPLLREALLNETEMFLPFHESAYNYFYSLVEKEKLIDAVALEEGIYHALSSNHYEYSAQWSAILVEYIRDVRLRLHDAKAKGIWAISQLEKKEVNFTISFASLLNETAVTLKRLNEFESAVNYFEMAYDINSKLKGESHETTMIILNNLAVTLSAQGFHKKAATCYSKILRIVRNTFGRDSLQTATVLNNLGAALSAGKNYEKALENFEKSLEIITKKLGTECNEFAVTINNQGEVWALKGEYERAEHCYQSAYNVACKLYREPHPSLATYLNNLGSLVFEKKQYNKAIGYYRKSVHMFRLCYGLFHLDTASGLSNLGDVLLELCETGDAEKNYRIAQTVFHDIAPKHPHNRILEEKLQKFNDLN